MTSLIRRFALVLCMLAVGAQAGAQVELLSQSRSVSGLGGWYIVGAVPDSILAPDFGPFQEDIEDSYWGWFAGDPSFNIWATQDSEIETGHFSIHGRTQSMLDPGEGDWGFYETSAHSDFEVLFEVLTPTQFSLIGTLVTAVSTNGSPYSSNIASLYLDWNGATYLSFSSGDNDEIAVSEDGILQPGTYTLTVNALSNEVLYFTEGSSRFDLDFFLEAPVATDQMAWGQVKALYR